MDPADAILSGLHEHQEDSGEDSDVTLIGFSRGGAGSKRKGPEAGAGALDSLETVRSRRPPEQGLIIQVQVEGTAKKSKPKRRRSSKELPNKSHKRHRGNAEIKSPESPTRRRRPRPRPSQGEAAGSSKRRKTAATSASQPAAVVSSNGDVDAGYDSDEHDQSLRLEEPLWAEEPQNYTHIDLNPSLWLGLSVSGTPFLNHNHGPRNTYNCAMSRAALGAHGTDIDRRFDTSASEMLIVERPLVGTSMFDLLSMYQLPAGLNVIVAIYAFNGMNQDDAIVLNKFSVQRGMFRGRVTRTVTSYESSRTSDGDMSTFQKLPKRGVRGRKAADYSGTDKDGIVAPGVKLYPDTVAFEKGFPIKDSPDLTWCDSVTMKPTEYGTVDSVMITNSDGSKMGRVKWHKLVSAQHGDKYASRHGQKGVCSIAVSLEDLPFTMDGEVPDMIVNPTGFPSRMTLAQIIEGLLSVIAAEHGTLADGSPFSKAYRECLYRACQVRQGQVKWDDSDSILEEISKALKAWGLEPSGNRFLVSGETGEPLEGRVFMVPTFYQALKHRVEDKIRARSRGKNKRSTQQPTDGRQREGGLKTGNMEKDCILAHGASATARDKVFLSSDPSWAHICKVCHFESIYTEEMDPAYCNHCGTWETSRKVFMPYAFRTFRNELFACLMNVQIKVRDPTRPEFQMGDTTVAVATTDRS